MEKIFDEFALVQPTCLSAAPRFYDQIYSQFKAAVNASKEANPTADTDDIKEEVGAQFRNILGSRMQYCVIGGAASGPAVKTFIWKYLHIPVYDGYGTSEAGGIASNEGLYPGVEVKLLDCTEMGYTTQDKPYPRGEILVRTPTTIQGYYRDEEATSANFLDGWFRTGDIGEQTPDGKLRLIDRKKSLFKLVQGVFVAPSAIENLLLKCNFVEQIFVYGDTSRANLVAIVVPNDRVIRDWWRTQGRTAIDDPRTFYDTLEVNLKFQAEIALTARSVKLPAYEIPAAVRSHSTCFPFSPFLTLTADLA
jgi:long-subunit acyl-CoA synthetase (AMP-forming)